MGFFLLPLLVAAVGQIGTVASQPLELAPRADNLCSSGDVEFIDLVKEMFTGFSMSYCKNDKPLEEQTWSTPLFWVTISSSADGCTAPAEMPVDACLDAFKQSFDACGVGSKISGTNFLWNGPDGTCLKFTTKTEGIERLETKVSHNEDLNEVDIGEGLYSCDDYMKLFDKAKDECLATGCDVNRKACDDLTCVTIDGTANTGLEDKFKNYLNDLRTFIAATCKAEAYTDSFCTPNGVCSSNKKVKVQIPSFIGTSTSKNDDIFVANYKVTFSQKALKAGCDIVATLVGAGVGILPFGSLLGSTNVLCGAA
ncbi:hypothetical protein NCS57_00513500 [Fusarium keratoplasticum]|uniref:Uncharacterized protein n=1 Tax=Fusarium keratoplasticum TaxID=1328300 RepID=A0ACC0QZ78_9HYPO|nr:hypothetical protein NCS57_00513500 [Fusarium keratoplasticum]KAI8670424.1 hypothetical protein NCS57_00513500 [Fusarium keratoplasticum]KAI8677641.1 hypothetical protein NCS55_00481300 [Fusarium keratoplasticum]